MSSLQEAPENGPGTWNNTLGMWDMSFQEPEKRFTVDTPPRKAYVKGMRNEKPGWCRTNKREVCEACADIDDTGLSYLDHTCKKLLPKSWLAPPRKNEVI